MLAITIALIAIAFAPARSFADDDVVQPWQGLGDNLAGIYGWPNVMFHVSAAAITPPLVYTVDEPFQRAMQEDDPIADPFGQSMLLAGGLLPIVVPLTTYFVGQSGDDAELATAGSAAIQAVVVQFVAVGALKWLTDRAGPFPDGDTDDGRWDGGLFRDSEHADDFDFNPFNLEGGMRWPSGHTASNFALVSSLVAFYPDELWLGLVGYPFAAAVGLGMVEGDYHWFSDVVAGALIGHVIGWVVGKGFRTRFDAQHHRPRAAGSAAMEWLYAPERFMSLVSVSADPLGLRIRSSF